MGKYGPGVSMKEAIRMEVHEAQAILASSNLSSFEQESIIGALKEMAYQWCRSNAGACALEEELKDRDPDHGISFNSPAFRRYMERSDKKFAETYPDWEEENG